MMMDLAGMVRMDVHSGTASDMQGVLAPYVMERFFKHLAVRRCWTSPSFRNAMQRRSAMRKPEVRTVRRAILGTWLAAGVLATGYGSLITGCTSAAPGSAPMTAPSGEIDSVDQGRAGMAGRADRGVRADLGGGGRPGRRSLLGRSGRLASGVRDRGPGVVRCGHRRLRRGARPDARLHPRPRVAGLGPCAGGPRLSHPGALADRAGTWLRAALPRQGGLLDLDDAVGAAPDDPVVRLVRASTYLGMPSIFGGADEGLADFDVLRGWTRDPASNPITRTSCARRSGGRATTSRGPGRWRRSAGMKTRPGPGCGWPRSPTTPFSRSWRNGTGSLSTYRNNRRRRRGRIRPRHGGAVEPPGRGRRGLRSLHALFRRPSVRGGGEARPAAPVAVRPALAGLAGVAVHGRGRASGAGAGRPPRRQGGGGSRHRHRVRHVERAGRDHPGDL